jgi:hypothetical protein
MISFSPLWGICETCQNWQHFGSIYQKTIGNEFMGEKSFGTKSPKNGKANSSNKQIRFPQTPI